MVPVAPEILGIAQAVAQVDIMLTAKEIEIVQIGVMTQFADTGRRRC